MSLFIHWGIHLSVSYHFILHWNNVFLSILNSLKIISEKLLCWCLVSFECCAWLVLRVVLRSSGGFPYPWQAPRISLSWGCKSVDVESVVMNLQYNFDGLMIERRNSIANALELGLSCVNPSICVRNSMMPLHLHHTAMETLFNSLWPGRF